MVFRTQFVSMNDVFLSLFVNVKFSFVLFEIHVMLTDRRMLLVR